MPRYFDYCVNLFNVVYFMNFLNVPDITKLANLPKLDECSETPESDRFREDFKYWESDAFCECQAFYKLAKSDKFGDFGELCKSGEPV